MTADDRAWRASRAATILVLLAAAGSFFTVTTFITDDFLFLTFARLVRNPLVAFVTDQHGGEFYRPLPMTLWWGLARVGGGSSLAFAAAALALHALVALEVTILAGAAGETKAVRVLAGIGFFLAPQCLDAAYWFSASTDLLATAAGLGSLIFLLRAGRSPALWGASVLCATLATFSKESALILAPLGLIVLGGRRAAALRVAPHAAVAVAFVAIRWNVLHGWGGTGDPQAPLPGKLLQILSGLVHIGTGATAWPEPLAWGMGVVALFCLARHVYRDLRLDDAGGGAWRPAAFTLVALLPLLGAEWAVGARYFYLPAVGVAWLAARCLVAASFPVRALVLAALVAASTLQGLQRHGDVLAYQRRVDVVRRAVITGLGAGQSTFHLAAGVKDLDLVVKESADVRRAAAGSPGLLVLSDVPASFVLLPSPVPERLRFLLASPPIPPSGAYRFGDRQVVGLARRGADPDLEQVVKQLPDLRFLRIQDDRQGTLVATDVTDAVLDRLRRP